MMNDEEISPNARFHQEKEEKTLMDLDISCEKIRFNKNFKHFLKKKKLIFQFFFVIIFFSF